MARSTGAPRRPWARERTASRADASRSRSTSASSQARSTWRRSTTSARSSRVRARVVHGMPSTSVTSSGGRDLVRWTSMPLSDRPPRRGVVTSIAARALLRTPNSAAASRWDSRAPGPHAKTAAIQRPLTVRRGWPTAYTPRCTRCRRPPATRLLTPLEVSPSAINCSNEMTPCWRTAIRAIVRSAAPSPGGGADCVTYALVIRPTPFMGATLAGPALRVSTRSARKWQCSILAACRAR